LTKPSNEESAAAARMRLHSRTRLLHKSSALDSWSNTWIADRQAAMLGLTASVLSVQYTATLLYATAPDGQSNGGSMVMLVWHSTSQCQLNCAQAIWKPSASNLLQTPAAESKRSLSPEASNKRILLVFHAHRCCRHVTIGCLRAMAGAYGPFHMNKCITQCV
jgi:hypothetical protein